MTKPAIWAVVPAAGIGKRMQSQIPKQYLTLVGKPILAHTIGRLLSFDCIDGVVVSLQPDDPYWAAIEMDVTAISSKSIPNNPVPNKPISAKPVVRAAGGRERCDSVLNALNTLEQQAGFNTSTDRVMVHDAVRPCLREEDINQLVDEVGDSIDGGLLALPVRDTMKRQHTGTDTVAETVEREGLWHALTPQYFGWRVLKTALEKALASQLAVTDESSAMEFAGYSPRLVCGHEDNIKITRPDDIRLAEMYLAQIMQAET